MRARLRPDDEHVGDRRVADPGLGADEPIAAVDLLGPRRHAAGIGAGARLGQAEAADELAARQARQVFAPLVLVAVGVDRIHDERALHAHHRAEAGVDPLDLARHQAVGDVTGAGAAEFLRQRHPEQPRFAHQAEELRVGLLLEIGLLDARREFLCGEISRGVADHPLVLGELGFEQERIVPLERTEIGSVKSAHCNALGFRQRRSILPGGGQRRGRAHGGSWKERGREPIIPEMQNDPLSHGLWEMTAPPAPPTSPLEGEVRADVAVVGCGYTGLSTALHLAEAGAKVVALEAVEIGFGGAGRNVGLVNAGMWLAPDDIVERLGADYGERLLNLLGGGPAEVYALVDKHGIDCELVRNGTLHCAVGRAGLAKIEERARQWGARGAPVRLLTQAETARRIGVDIYAGSLLDLRAGIIQPLAYARGLAGAAIAAGAAIHTRSPVRSAERTGKTWTLATDGGTVIADWIAVATDAYGGPAMAAGAPRAGLRALFQFRHPAFERRAAGRRSSPAARAAGTRG